MPCDTRLKRGQTIQERAREVRAAAAKLEAALRARAVTVKVGPSGSVAFSGWAEADRDGLTDACAFRRLMAAGSVDLRRELARAEAEAGRTVDRQAIGAGVHSHDGGRTWHGGH